MNEVMANLKRFAHQHGLTLVEKGEVGIGRSAVGFLGNEQSYIDYNPHNSETYEDIEEMYDGDLEAPNEVEAYHKHNCIAVLVRDDNYEEGLRQLNEWIKHIESKGLVQVVDYQTGAKGMQALFTGTTGKALMFLEKF